MTIERIQATAISTTAMRIAAPAPFAVAAAAAAPAQSALEHQPEDEFGEERDHARDDHRDHQHAHVAVADVGQLVPEHRSRSRRRRARLISPEVTVIEYCFSFMPVANALRRVCPR